MSKCSSLVPLCGVWSRLRLCSCACLDTVNVDSLSCDTTIVLHAPLTKVVRASANCPIFRFVHGHSQTLWLLINLRYQSNEVAGPHSACNPTTLHTRASTFNDQMVWHQTLYVNFMFYRSLFVTAPSPLNKIIINHKSPPGVFSLTPSIWPFLHRRTYWSKYPIPHNVSRAVVPGKNKPSYFSDVLLSYQFWRCSGWWY